MQEYQSAPAVNRCGKAGAAQLIRPNRERKERAGEPFIQGRVEGGGRETEGATQAKYTGGEGG